MSQPSFKANSIRSGVFRGIISAVSICCRGRRHLLWSAFVLLFFIAPEFNTLQAALVLPSNLPGEWSAIGRVKIQTAEDSAVISGFVVPLYCGF